MENESTQIVEEVKKPKFIELIVDDKTIKYASKSDAIRKLAKAEKTKSEIAKILNCRYQMVRNILENEKNNLILKEIKTATK